jgi:hypothetical protein
MAYRWSDVILMPAVSRESADDGFVRRVMAVPYHTYGRRGGMMMLYARVKTNCVVKR